MATPNLRSARAAYLAISAKSRRDVVDFLRDDADLLESFNEPAATGYAKTNRAVIDLLEAISADARKRAAKKGGR